MGDLKNKVVTGAAWAFSQKVFGQVSSFFVTMVLSRLLTPTDYGTVALLAIFFTISEALIDCGMGWALVQKKNPTELQFNSVFWLSVFMSTVLYLILFFAAPAIESFYAVPDLRWMLRVSAFSLVFGAINSVQSVELSRNLAFNLSFRISVITTITSATAGITFALLGFGPWAIVLQGTASGLMGVVAYWFIIAWRPKWMFSFSALKDLFAFGWKMTAMNLIAYVTRDVYGLIIGKYYTPADLAFVNKGRSLPNLLMGSISGTIFGVSFPALAKLQDSKERLREGMSRMLQCITFLVFPLMCGLAICTPDIMRLLFGTQWKPAEVFMQIVCFQCALTPLADVNMQGMAATGRANYFIPMQIIKTGTGLAVLLISLYFGVFYFVLMQCVFCKLFEIAVNSWPNRKLFNYPIERQVAELLPTLLCCAVMAGVVFATRQLLFSCGISGDTILQLVIRLSVLGAIGAGCYFLVAYILKVRAMQEYIEIIRPRILAMIRRSAVTST